jgi:hypothetical protein
MTKDKNIIHETFVTDILTILTAARQKAYSAVNFAMVDAYWRIGKRIIEEEQQGKGRADYGTYLIKKLAQRLSGQLGKGFRSPISGISGNSTRFFHPRRCSTHCVEN